MKISGKTIAIMFFGFLAITIVSDLDTFMHGAAPDVEVVVCDSIKEVQVKGDYAYHTIKLDTCICDTVVMSNYSATKRKLK